LRTFKILEVAEETLRGAGRSPRSNFANKVPFATTNIVYRLPRTNSSSTSIPSFFTSITNLNFQNILMKMAKKTLIGTWMQGSGVGIELVRCEPDATPSG